MNTVHYIAYYGKADNCRDLHIAPSSITKASYIISAIKRAGFKVSVFSTAETKKRFFCHYGYYEEHIDEQETNIYIDTFGSKYKFVRILAILWAMFQLFFYLVTKVKKGEQVLIYHSCLYRLPIYWARKFNKFRLILEVEEVYTNAIPCSERLKRRELRFIESADRYIFITELLNQKFNLNNKPYCILYGTYQVEPVRHISFDDEKIHVVYAGTFCKHKAGAYRAISAAEFLDDRYHLHIIGFGSDDEKLAVQDAIEKIRGKTACTVTYDGLLRGEQYTDFLQKCHIGLSTQEPEGEYNETSFPSKVLSYMANGLRVVSIKIKVLEICKVANLLYFYNDNSGEKIAEAIKRIDINDGYNSRVILSELDREFCRAIVQVVSLDNCNRINISGGLL